MISWPLVFAIASPILWGLTNIIDKYVVAHKVKRPLGFASIAIVWVSFFGAIVALFVDWDGIDIGDMILPMISGLLSGPYFFLYYFSMEKEDASHVIGLVSFFPIIVALLSFFILGERIPLVGYLGMALVLCGILAISIRLRQIKLKTGLLAILSLVFIAGISEFITKIVVMNIPVWNGIAISSMMFGVSALFFMLIPRIRHDFISELGNLKWGIVSEAVSSLGVIAFYFAMLGLPATIVSSIAATQPVGVLFFERIADGMFGKMKRDHLLLPKLGAILLIVLGVILLSIAGT